MRRLPWLVPMILLVGAPAAMAQSENLRGSIVGNTAELVDPGELEVTFGVEFEDDDDKHTTGLFIEFQYGVNERLEVGLRVPYLFVDPNESGERRVDGVGDIEISADVAMITDPLLVTPSLTLTLPTGDDDKSEDLGEGSPIIEPMVTMEIPIGELIGIVELGGEFTRGSRAFVWSGTLAKEIEETVVSLGVEGSVDNEHTSEVSLVPGFGFEIIEDVDLAVEMQIGLTKDTPDWGITVEFTYGF